MVYIDHRGISGKLYVGGARVYNAFGICWEYTLLARMVGFNLVDVS